MDNHPTATGGRGHRHGGSRAGPVAANLSAHCPNGQCALEAIRHFQAVLKDPTKPAQDRREALFFLAHFIGDIHQPLHCAERADDHGGNLVRVRSGANDRHLTNLHKVWDTELVEEAVGPLTLADYATRLSQTLGSDRLSGEYLLDGAEVVEMQLTKGGVRLAQFLNDNFKE